MLVMAASASDMFTSANRRAFCQRSSPRLIAMMRTLPFQSRPPPAQKRAMSLGGEFGSAPRTRASPMDFTRLYSDAYFALLTLKILAGGEWNCAALVTANGVTNAQPMKAGVVTAGNSGAGVSWCTPTDGGSEYAGRL